MHYGWSDAFRNLKNLFKILVPALSSNLDFPIFDLTLRYFGLSLDFGPGTITKKPKFLLAPTGAQEVTLCVCLSVIMLNSSLNLHAIFSSLSAISQWSLSGV